MSAAFCSGGVVHASDRAAITPRVGISQQEGSLKGTVSDSFGPVAGASIVVKGTTNGTVTDMNGNFVLDVKNGDVIVLASSCEGKVNLIVMATDAAMKQGAHAGNLIRSIAGKVGGGGGGRPNMAQAGGKNPAGILEAIAEAKTALEAQLS